MSNHTMFDKKYIGTLLEQFFPGIGERYTPIRYEALTPDAFMFLFMTYGVDGSSRFFVVYEADHFQGVESTRCSIEDWHGSFGQLMLPSGRQGKDDVIDTFKIETTGPYFAVCAKVEAPIGKGYWSTKVTIAPGDDILEKLEDFSDEDKASAMKTLERLLAKKVPAGASFAESFAAKHQGVITDGKNTSDMAVTVFRSPNGSLEYFSSYVKDKA